MTFGGRGPDLAILVEDEVVVVEVLHRESSLRRSLLRISCHLRIDTDQPLRTSGPAVRAEGPNGFNDRFHAIEEQGPVEMVDLVCQRPGLEAGRPDRDGLAIGL